MHLDVVTIPVARCRILDSHLYRRRHNPARQLAIIGLAAVLFATVSANSQDLIVCGGDEVYALRIMGTNVTPLWEWTATNSNLPEWCKPLFATTDECKPCSNRKVLVTSSGGLSLNGAVALVDPLASSASNVLFYARAPNAHSADLLPSNRVAVALSYQTNGNRLAIYDLAQSDVELFSVNLHGAHGVVWDDARQVLWAMGENFLYTYELQNWDSLPQLKLISTRSLPETGGHDMFPVPDSPEMTISTGWHCWLFNRDTGTFAPHPLLADTVGVKCITVRPFTSEIVYVQAEIQWWAERLRFLLPQKTIHFPGGQIYKARWIPPESLPPPGPQISIFRTSTNTTVVHWPSTATGFELQQNPDPGVTSSWEPSAEPIEDDGTKKFLILNSSAGQRFYRLIKSGGQ